MGRANEGFGAVAGTFHHSWSLLNSRMVGRLSRAAGLKPRTGQLESGDDVGQSGNGTEKCQKTDRLPPDVRNGPGKTHAAYRHAQTLQLKG